MRCNGIGLSDGETMERMWSYLRRFGRMTKEMRPAHRTDIISSALVHYGLKTKAKLGSEGAHLGNIKCSLCTACLHALSRQASCTEMEKNARSPQDCN